MTTKTRAKKNYTGSPDELRRYPTKVRPAVHEQLNAEADRLTEANKEAGEEVPFVTAAEIVRRLVSNRYGLADWPVVSEPTMAHADLVPSGSSTVSKVVGAMLTDRQYGAVAAEAARMSRSGIANVTPLKVLHSIIAQHYGVK